MALTITFKDEDEQDGVPVGPVIVWDTGQARRGPVPCPDGRRPSGREARQPR